MSRRYTPDQQAYALQYLAACNGDVNLTAAALGIPQRTLFRWRQLHALNPVPPLPQSLPQFPLNPVPQVPLLPQFPLNPLPLPQNNVSFPLLPGAPQVSLNPAPPMPQSAPLVPQAENTLPLTLDIYMRAMLEFQRRMIGKVQLLLETIEPTIAAAPLPQRVMAITRLTDRIIHLAAHLAVPSEGAEAEEAQSIVIVDEGDKAEMEDFYRAYHKSHLDDQSTPQP